MSSNVNEHPYALTSPTIQSLINEFPLNIPEQKQLSTRFCRLTGMYLAV